MVHTSKESLKKKSSLKIGDVICFKGIAVRYVLKNNLRASYYLGTVGIDNVTVCNMIYTHFGLSHEKLSIFLGRDNFLSSNIPDIMGIDNMRKLLIRMYEIEEELNYTNLVLSNSFIDFLKRTRNNDKICEILFRERNKLDDSGINYIDTEEDGNISFMPKGKIQAVTENGEWINKGRQAGKPSKIIRSIIPKKILPSLTDSDFERFSNIYKSNIIKDGQFEIVSGTDIKKYYHGKMYVPHQGTLNNLV